MENIRASVDRVLNTFASDISPSKQQNFEASLAEFLRSQGLVQAQKNDVNDGVEQQIDVEVDDSYDNENELDDGASNFLRFQHIELDAADEEDEEGEEDEYADLELDDSQNFVPPSDEFEHDDPYPKMEKKEEILAFFRSPRRTCKLSSKASKMTTKTLAQIQHLYPKIKDLRILYRWEKYFETGK